MSSSTSRTALTSKSDAGVVCPGSFKILVSFEQPSGKVTKLTAIKHRTMILLRNSFNLLEVILSADRGVCPYALYSRGNCFVKPMCDSQFEWQYNYQISKQKNGNLWGMSNRPVLARITDHIWTIEDFVEVTVRVLTLGEGAEANRQDSLLIKWQS